MNGAAVLCDTLLSHEVDVCFANPGTSEMHFVAALDDRPEMRCVLGLFEGVVTGAADGYGRMRDKPAATLLHLGPGLANGIANLHNAKRARTPIINVVGDHASYHLKYDAPLTSDLDALAHPMSDWVGRIVAADTVMRTTKAAYHAAMTMPGVATLILPADAAWGHTRHAPTDRVVVAGPAKVDGSALRSAAAALRTRGRTALILGDKALRAEALEFAGRISRTTGAKLFAETSNSRIQRGRGRVAVTRIPYGIEQATAVLREYDTVILVGSRLPVAFFAYPDKPAFLLPETCQTITLADPTGFDLTDALERLADECGCSPSAPCRVEPSAFGVDLPSGQITDDALSMILARFLPEGAIVSDESITSARRFLTFAQSSPAHDHLQLTGGAIGTGIPMATGAAIACPDRKVVSLQADGSGMYTLQGLWTQAREQLDVVTVILSNRSYATLRGEMNNLGITQFGENAKRMIDLEDPAINWVGLAQSLGVEAARADTAEELIDLYAGAMRRRGPFLIEATINPQ